MVAQTTKEIIVPVGEFCLSSNSHEILKALRVAASIVVVAYDPTAGRGGIAHMALPESKIASGNDRAPGKFVDLGLPLFIEAITKHGGDKAHLQIKIVGGSQLFNFGGGSGNLLNIGTRNAITARTILNREGLPVEKTETGGNKPRNVMLDIATGQVQVSHPGESPRII